MKATSSFVPPLRDQVEQIEQLLEHVVDVVKGCHKRELKDSQGHSV